MSQIDIATPRRTREIMEKNHFQVKKSLGQNFLVDPNILTKIISVSGIDEHSNVIEIGPGIGALTERLARVAQQVVAFEIDGRLLPILEETLADYDNIHIVHADILKVDLQKELEQHIQNKGSLHVVANLPYYITTPIIMNLLESGVQVDSFTMMMQKEVAQRMTAQPRSKAYGSLTIAIQYWCEASIAFVVPKTVFNPAPNVDSAILVLKKRSKPYVTVKNESHFFDLVRNSFSQRRKTLWNNLIKAYPTLDQNKEELREVYRELGMKETVRAEELTIEEFARLSDALVFRSEL